MLVTRAIQWGIATALLIAAGVARWTWIEEEGLDEGRGLITIWNFIWVSVLGSFFFILIWLLVLLFVSKLHKMSTGYALFEKPNQDNKNQ